MNPKDFVNSTAGKVFRNLKGYWAFIPNPLPPVLEWNEELVSTLSEADRAITRLAEIGKGFPAPFFQTQSFIRREAVMSSRIEGTRTNFIQLLEYEVSPHQTNHDAQEVKNYVTAMNYALHRVKSLPISLRLIREIHEKLMSSVRGDLLTPGEFRKSQNWIGPANSTIETASYVPPPYDEMMRALNALESFIHSNSLLPPLIKTGLIHYQFEAIHPFLDGNGRLGRLLTTLLLCRWNILPIPLLYLSDYFVQYRQDYYDNLLAVSQHGKWEQWLQFFLKGVAQQSLEAISLVEKLITLRKNYYRLVRNDRSEKSLHILIDYLFGHPMITIKQIAETQIAGSYTTAQRFIQKLVDLSILREISGQARNQVFAAPEILRLIQTE